MGARRIIGLSLRRLRAALAELAVDETDHREIPFDNTYDWLGLNLERLMKDPLFRWKPHYVWGVLQGCALAKVLGYKRASVIEFGVAAGAGLLRLERIAQLVEDKIGIGIEVYGFDTGIGLPKPQDYRDCPNLWLDGQYPMDVELLSSKLRKASLKLGLIKDTLPAFLQNAPAPVAFAAIDVDLYSSTKELFKLFEAPHDRLLPRIVCYFDDIIGDTFNEYNGERLAINEFNAEHALRKICPIYGLRHYVPTKHRNSHWPELMYFAHCFDHPLYNQRDSLRKPMRLNIDGAEADWKQAQD